MFSWKTLSLPATCIQLVGDPQRIHPTDAALMTSATTWSSSGAETAHQLAHGECWGDQVV
jgi:hypothetical protein